MSKRFCATAIAAVAALVGSTFVATPSARAVDTTTDGGFEFTLAGVGNSNNDVDAGTASLEVSAGLFIGPMFEVGLRQSVGYADDNAGTEVNAASRGFADLQFNLGRVAPFVGANVGYIYGEGVSDTWAGGPEAGLKVYLGSESDVFVYGRVEYQFFFDKGDEIDDVIDDGQFIYSLGIGLRF
jgi:hypothetical protein